jgi:pyruvate-formate lyase-activating enzyme
VRVQDIRESIAMVIESGIPHEFRTTYLEPLLSPQDVREIAALVAGCRRLVLQSFRPSSTLDDRLRSLPRTADALMLEMQKALQALGVEISVR